MMGWAIGEETFTAISVSVPLSFFLEIHLFSGRLSCFVFRSASGNRTHKLLLTINVRNGEREG